MPLIEIYRVRVAPENVERLLEVREAAVADFREQVPELLSGELVRLENDEWLDILTWSEDVDPERISKGAEATPTAIEMHSLIAEELGHHKGELVHSTRPEWVPAR